MTREYCTLFDSNYLLKFMVMHESLRRVGASFQITAFCFDDLAYDLLGTLGLENVNRVSLAELEQQNPALAGVKNDRTPVEYCWTATPTLPLYMFATRPDLDEVTYLDADLMFFRSPDLIFEEMGNASVLITPHRFSPEHAEQEENGIYNVQFLTFRRDHRAMECLQWWHDRCIEWCYYRLEDGKLGDQKYLDDWPDRFEGVHVLQHKGGGLAPWNVSQYTLRPDSKGVLVDAEPLIFYHYHRVRILKNGGGFDWRPPGYVITRRQRRLVYDPYIDGLKVAHQRVLGIDSGFSAGFEPRLGIRERIRRVYYGARAEARRLVMGRAKGAG